MARAQTYSYSKLSCFEKCELQFHLKYNERLRPGLDSIERFLGVLVHEIVEKVQTDDLPRQLSVCLEYLMDEWSAKYDGRLHFDVRRRGEPWWKDHAIRCVSNFFRKALPNGDELAIELEKKESMPLLETPMCSFTGIIDRLVEYSGGVYEVHDYKTGKPAARMYFERDHQLPLYAHMVARTRGVPDDQGIEVRRYYLATGEVQSFRVNEARRAAAWRWAVTTAMSIIEFQESGRDAKPHLGPLCDWCDFKRSKQCSAQTGEDIGL